MGMGGNVENAGLSAVGVADKGHIDGLASLGSNVLCGTLLAFGNAPVVVVVLYLFCGFGFADNLHFCRVAASQRHFKIHDSVFDGVLQRGVEDRLNGDSFDESHLYNALAKGSVSRHANHYAFLTCL